MTTNPAEFQGDKSQGDKSQGDKSQGDKSQGDKSQGDKSQGDSEVFRFGGFGTVLLISLLAFIGLYPLMLGEIAGRLADGVILAVILVSSAVTAIRSFVYRFIGGVLAIVSLGLQIDWVRTNSRTVEVIDGAVLAIFFYIRHC
jgi:hypothetical protein